MLTNVVLPALLYAGGIYWCLQIYGRRRHDVRRMKESSDNTEKVVIVFIWLLTALVFLWVVSFSWWIVKRIFGSLLEMAG